MNVIKKRVDFFLQRKEWYNEKGIPYTLGLLLSGQAGAGKTSTIKCLANETKRHIINLNLNNDISKTQMDNLFFNEMLMVLNMSTGQTEKYFIPLNQRIYVLEDIDCQSDLVMERELKIKHRPESQDLKPFLKLNTKTNPHKPGMYENEGDVMSSQAEKIDLSFLLNLLDGVLENPGRIVIMTSNYPEWLDHALIRPGRIDVIANFKKCTHKTIIEMMVFFFDLKSLTKEEEELICKLPEDLFSPAEMSKLMFEHMDDKNKVFEALYSFMPREFPNGTALHALPLAPLPPQNPIQSILKKEKTPVLVNESIDKIKNESNELKDLQNFDKSNEKNKNLHHTFHQSMFLDANINDDKNPVSSSFQSLESLKNKTTSKEAEVDPEPFSFSSAGAFESF